MTAYEIPGQRIAFKAGADLTDKVYKALTMDTNGNVVVAGADAVIVGALQREAKSGEPSTVMINGITFGYLGGTVAYGAKVSTDADGNYVTATTGPVVGVCVFGGDAGDLSSILLK